MSGFISSIDPRKAGREIASVRSENERKDSSLLYFCVSKMKMSLLPTIEFVRVAFDKQPATLS